MRKHFSVTKCRKCGNEKIPAPQNHGSGITSQRCWVCGEQNYSFPKIMKQRTGGNEVFDMTCKRCGDVFFLNYKGSRMYCDDCLPIVRMKITSERNARLREAGRLKQIVLGKKRAKGPWDEVPEFEAVGK